MHRMQVLMDVEVADDDAYASIARRWLTEASAGLAPALWAQLQGELPLSDGPLEDRFARAGQPNGVWASLFGFSMPEAPGVYQTPFSEENFNRLLDSAGRRQRELKFELWRLDDQGCPPMNLETLIVQVSVDISHRSWIQLRASSSLKTIEGDLGSEETASRWTNILKNTADQTDPSFGHICDDGVDHRTALDFAIRRHRFKSMLEGRDFLRGYSWVTICPRELAAKVGGIEAMRISDAFYRVEELSRGALLLQATKTYDGYTQKAVERVFEVLAPILPEGEPKDDKGVDVPYRLAWRNARG